MADLWDAEAAQCQPPSWCEPRCDLEPDGLGNRGAASGGGPAAAGGSGPVASLTPTPSRDELEAAAVEALAKAVRRNVKFRNRFDDGDASDCSEDSGVAAAKHVPVPTFESAKKYDGHRMGRIFKLWVGWSGVLRR